jgi:hypothetical protein
MITMQKEKLLQAIRAQAEKAYEVWQSDAYRKTQAVAAQVGQPVRKGLVRYTIKEAHILELMQRWWVPLCGGFLCVF